MWVCGVWRQIFDISGRISADRLYFRKIYPYNSFSFKIVQLIRISSFCSPNFPIFVDFLKTTTFTYTTRSSSGWVLMDLKVLPSKSSHSQLHFSYLSYLYISHQSKVTSWFWWKLSRLTTFWRPYQMCFSFFFQMIEKRLKMCFQFFQIEKQLKNAFSFFYSNWKAAQKRDFSLFANLKNSPKTNFLN